MGQQTHLIEKNTADCRLRGNLGCRKKRASEQGRGKERPGEY